MANIKANKKRHEQDEKKRVQNHSEKSKLKTMIKKAMVSKKDEDFNAAISCIDSALSKGIIKKNKANRLKSRLHANVKTK